MKAITIIIFLIIVDSYLNQKTKNGKTIGFINCFCDVGIFCVVADKV